jgi:hypothetical protein
MKTHVEFRSSAFPAYEGEEAKINPGLWGKRLAEFLQKKLEEEKISTEEIYFEDWGVALPIKNEDFPLWIGCGHYQEYEDGFLCFIEPSKPTIRAGCEKLILLQRFHASLTHSIGFSVAIRRFAIFVGGQKMKPPTWDETCDRLITGGIVSCHSECSEKSRF